ncbi:aldo/keto reductase [Sphingobacterium pedocola]|uniref:Oxidoreductase n=1 Tax=Sphingobacterium pedocola TaxID=2082722 RepID=A0ABR9T2J2_9SPHI|nr:aldo/keto reductase [Sphingobacterium pedocola]MBE8719555.1 oxidoreductase [Sphingobacterium pedocola]
MRYNNLGHSDLKISEIGFGGMSLEGGASKANIDLISEAFDHGINYFDTADLYDKGLNEELIGKAVHTFRDRIVLATKVGNEWRADGSGWDWNPRKDYILRMADKSLQRLKTDYIDVYQLHGGTIEDAIDEVIEAFELLVKAGKIKYYGISSIRPNVFTPYLNKSNIASNMMQYSLLDRRPERYFEIFKAHNTGIISRGSLAQGLLLDKKAKPYLGYEPGEIELLNADMEELSRQLEVSKQAIALAYVLQHDVVASAVVGIRTHNQMNGLWRAWRDLEKLRDQDFSMLLTDLRPIHYTDHLS